MAKRNTSPMRRRKAAHKHFKQHLSGQLLTFEEALSDHNHIQQFYSRAMITLVQEGDIDSWVMGALLAERHLRAESDALLQQIHTIRAGVQNT